MSVVPESSTDLPLFPLSSVVMPEGLLPLRLFEPRYIDMVKNCFKTDTGFGVCLIRSGLEAGEVADPYPRGTLVSIVDFDQGADGLLHITGKGVAEFNLHDYRVQSDGLLVGEVSMIETVSGSPLKSEHASLASKLDMILQYVESHLQYSDKKLGDDQWVSNRLIELLPLDAEAKYAIIDMPDTQSRLDALNALHFVVEAESETGD